MVERLGEEVSGAAADGFESGLEGILRGHDDEVDAGVAAQGAIEEVKGIGIFKVQVGEDQAAAAHADKAESLFGVAGGDGIVAHVGDQGVESIALGRVAVEDAGSEGGVEGGDVYGFVSCVCHARHRGNRCAKREDECAGGTVGG